MHPGMLKKDDRLLPLGIEGEMIDLIDNKQKYRTSDTSIDAGKVKFTAHCDFDLNI